MSNETQSATLKQADEAQRRGDFVLAKELFTRLRAETDDADPRLVQRLALVTYKSKKPTPLAALEEARDLLKTLDPATSDDTETLGLWGAVHKRLWELTEDRAHLDESVRGYGRGFHLLNDYYNGINLAYLLNVRAANSASRAEAVADFEDAGRVRREVLSIGEALFKEGRVSEADKYWVLASMAEAHVGLGDEATAERTLQEAAPFAAGEWMKESTEEQLGKLRSLLADSPLKNVREEGDA